LVSPVTVALVASGVMVLMKEPGELVMVYPVTGEPLPETWAQDTWADLSPRTALGAAGWSGTAAGMAVLEGGESGPVPPALVAFTVKV
jgi:hypothetical protein